MTHKLQCSQRACFSGQTWPRIGRAACVVLVVLLQVGSGFLPASARAESSVGFGVQRADRRQVTVDPDIPAYAPAPPLTGDLHLVGGGGTGNEVEELMAAWAAIFHQAHPLVRVHLAIYTSGCTPSTLVEERAQVGVMTRDVWPFEYSLYRNRRFQLLEIVAAGAAFDTHGFSRRQCIYVHKDNPLSKLSLDQLDAVFSTSRKRGFKEDITRWGQLGLTGEWADKPIHLYGNISQPDGNPYYFQLRVLLGGDWKEGFKPLRERDDIARDRYAIGFGPANHAGGRSAEGQWLAGELNDAKTVALGETAAGPFYSCLLYTSPSPRD